MFTDEKVNVNDGVKSYVSPKIQAVMIEPNNSILQTSGGNAGGDSGETDPWE